MKTYKAISLKQPWANLVIQGKKTIETRKWNTHYRGDLVICSSKSPKIHPAGCALGIVELYHIEPMNKKHEKKACVEVYSRAHSWFIRNARIFKEPIPVKGQLSLFNIRLSDIIEFK